MYKFVLLFVYLQNKEDNKISSLKYKWWTQMCIYLQHISIDTVTSTMVVSQEREYLRLNKLTTLMNLYGIIDNLWDSFYFFSSHPSTKALKTVCWSKNNCVQTRKKSITRNRINNQIKSTIPIHRTEENICILVKLHLLWCLSQKLHAN